MIIYYDQCPYFHPIYVNVVLPRYTDDHHLWTFGYQGICMLVKISDKAVLAD
jgi:hypothetical protein